MQATIIKKIILIIIFLHYCLFISKSIAGQLEVTPTQISINNTQKYTAITVKNLDKNKVFIQAELLKWDLDKDNKHQYTESNNLIITPPLFSIDGQSEQILRIGQKNINTNNNTEISYRLILSELPDQYNIKNGLKVLLRLSLPVFIKPIKETALELEWTNKVINNNVILSIYNPNNIHKKINKIELKDKLNKKLYEQQNAFIYLLPKQRHNIQIKNNEKLISYLKDTKIKDSYDLALNADTENNSIPVQYTPAQYNKDDIDNKQQNKEIQLAKLDKMDKTK